MTGASSPRTSVRRYDIDWLRVLLFALLIGYHYMYYSLSFGAILETTPVRTTLEIVHQWRLAALFAISGMGTAFAFRSRTWQDYLKERGKRLLIPLLFAAYFLLGLSRILTPVATTRRVLAIFPAADVMAFGHMWFVYNLLIYSVALTPLFVYVRSRPDGRLIRFVGALLDQRRGAGALLLPPLLLALAGILAKPWRPGYLGMYWEFVWYLLFFALGYLLLVRKASYFSLLDRIRVPVTLLTPILAILFTVSRERLAVPDIMIGGWAQQGYPALSWQATLGTLIQAYHAWFWCLLLFSWAAKLLNRPSRGLTYLNQAIYPVYIVHQQFIFVVALLLAGMAISPYVRALLLGPLLVALGCLVIFEIVKRARFARLAFGVKVLPGDRMSWVLQGRQFGWAALFHGLTVLVIIGLNVASRIYWLVTG